jgi:hypothetical protein
MFNPPFSISRCGKKNPRGGFFYRIISTRKFFFAFPLFLLLFLFSCMHPIPFQKKMLIPEKGVDFIEISTNTEKREKGDSLSIHAGQTHRLSQEQTELFVSKWNAAKSEGPCLFITEYLVEITFTTGRKRSFRSNHGSIKESEDMCFSLGDAELIARLWRESK